MFSFKSSILLAAVATVVFALMPFASAHASVSDAPISGYAWSSEIGWINFGTTGGNTRITDTAVTGYAWNENTGWINLAPTHGGVNSNSSGTLSGKAWSEGTGWINFSGITVDSSGHFLGTAAGDIASINFSCAHCSVTTDWRPASARGGGSSSGGGGGGFGGAGSSSPHSVELKITSIKTNYNQDEEVIIGGTTEANTLINMQVDNRYGTFYSDSSGNWIITLGKMSLGHHLVTFTPQDSVGNAGKPVSAEFWVVVPSPIIPFIPPILEPGNILPQLPSFILGPPLAPILRELSQGIKDVLPNLFSQLAKIQPKPIAVITVPKKAPLAFSGNFHYLSSEKLSLFALAPLPKEVKVLAQKFPEVQDTFNKVGIEKITDLQKLANANLKLPNLTETVLPPVAIAPGKFAVLKGIAVDKLTVEAKSKIPSETVFAKAAGGLVDFNAALSLNSEGQTQQTIETVVGKPLQLVVRVDKPVKNVIGYIIFKSKNYNQTSFQIPVTSLTASLLFSNPTLTAPPSKIDQRLVLSEFEYQDTGNGVYTATIQTPLVDGKYEIITVMNYVDETFAPKEIKLITVVDPEGYVYEKNGNQETRIAGAIVSLYWLNPDNKKYELWPATDFQQEDPQTTDVRGTYSFLVPTGYYYIKVDAPGYLSYEGKPFEVKEGSGVHTNIEMKTKYWFLNIIDWKTLLLIAVMFLLLYNFYKDRRREKRI